MRTVAVQPWHAIAGVDKDGGASSKMTPSKLPHAWWSIDGGEEDVGVLAKWKDMGEHQPHRRR